MEEWTDSEGHVIEATCALGRVETKPIGNHYRIVFAVCARIYA
jgi:hypothetical protein